MTQGSVNTPQRRVHARYRYVKRVQLLLPDGQLVHGETWDICEGGASITCERSLPAGVLCQLGFLLYDRNGARAFAVSATVRHVVLGREGFRHGLQFGAMPASTRTVLRALLLQLEQQANEFNAPAADAPGETQ